MKGNELYGRFRQYIRLEYTNKKQLRGLMYTEEVIEK